MMKIEWSRYRFVDYKATKEYRELRRDVKKQLHQIAESIAVKETQDESEVKTMLPAIMLAMLKHRPVMMPWLTVLPQNYFCNNKRVAS
jgi:hypothetical protein